MIESSFYYFSISFKLIFSEIEQPEVAQPEPEVVELEPEVAEPEPEVAEPEPEPVLRSSHPREQHEDVTDKRQSVAELIAAANRLKLYDNDFTSIINIYFYETFSTPNSI